MSDEVDDRGHDEGYPQVPHRSERKEWELGGLDQKLGGEKEGGGGGFDVTRGRGDNRIWGILFFWWYTKKKGRLREREQRTTSPRPLLFKGPPPPTCLLDDISETRERGEEVARRGTDGFPLQRTSGKKDMVEFYGVLVVKTYYE